jgi:hypothetical protein
MVQPSLDAIRPIFVVADFCLKLSYLDFGPSKLSNQFALVSTAYW